MWDEMEPGWSTGNAFDEPRTSETVVSDIAAAGQGVDNSGTGGMWGVFSGALDKLTSVAVAGYSARTNAQLQAQRQQTLATQPLLSTSGGTLGINPVGLLLIGGFGLAVVMAMRAKG